jgi:hypothetical protein
MPPTELKRIGNISMKHILTGLLVLWSMALGAAPASSTVSRSIMEASNMIVAPQNFWPTQVFSVPFSNAVNAVVTNTGGGGSSTGGVAVVSGTNIIITTNGNLATINATVGTNSLFWRSNFNNGITNTGGDVIVKSGTFQVGSGHVFFQDGTAALDYGNITMGASSFNVRTNGAADVDTFLTDGSVYMGGGILSYKFWLDTLGGVTITNLAGIGNRFVQVDANGKMSASTTVGNDTNYIKTTSGLGTNTIIRNFTNYFGSTPTMAPIWTDNPFGYTWIEYNGENILNVDYKPEQAGKVFYWGDDFNAAQSIRVGMPNNITAAKSHPDPRITLAFLLDNDELHTYSIHPWNIELKYNYGEHTTMLCRWGTWTNIVTIHSGTTNGQYLQLQDRTILWTNSVADSNNQVLTNVTAAGSTTNLYTYLTAHPFTGLTVAYASATSLQVRTVIGWDLFMMIYNGNYGTPSWNTGWATFTQDGAGCRGLALGETNGITRLIGTNIYFNVSTNLAVAMQLNSDQTAAFYNDVTNAGSLWFENDKSISFKNSSGTYKNAISMTGDDEILVGSVASGVPVLIYGNSTTVGSLAGAGTRLVQTDANGVLSATMNTNTVGSSAGTNIDNYYTAFPSATNTLTLNNGYWLYNASGDCSVTNVAGQTANKVMWATLAVSNASASAINFRMTGGLSIRPQGLQTTNNVVLASGKMAVFSAISFGTLNTNYCNTSQQ